jgi:hypothetical protein
VETYLAPLCSLSPVALEGVLKSNWLTVLAVVLVTAGQTLATRNT